MWVYPDGVNTLGVIQCGIFQGWDHFEGVCTLTRTPMTHETTAYLDDEIIYHHDWTQGPISLHQVRRDIILRVVEKHTNIKV